MATLEEFIEGLQMRVPADCDYGGHVERTAQMAIAGGRVAQI